MHTHQQNETGRVATGQLVSEASAYQCSKHGKPTKRAVCSLCNAAYQRGYLKRRRMEAPAKEMWRRCRSRARKSGIAFEIPDTLVIPDVCPVLAIDLKTGGPRSASSPSLDRIDPDLGYIPGNVRIISDRANRLKSNRSLKELKALSISGPMKLRAEYGQVVDYLDRELLLKEVWRKAELGGSLGAEWLNIAAFLEKAFQRRPDN